MDSQNQSSLNYRLNFGSVVYMDKIYSEVFKLYYSKYACMLRWKLMKCSPNDRDCIHVISFMAYVECCKNHVCISYAQHNGALVCLFGVK